MSIITANSIRCVATGETRNVSISFVPELDVGELLTGTPTVVELTTANLTLTNKVVNTGALTVERNPVAIGQGVQFKLTGAVAGTNYRVLITVTTDATPAQTLQLVVQFEGVAAL